MKNIKQIIKILIDELNLYERKEKIDAINYIKKEIHNISPFKNSPIDFVTWIPNDEIKYNDYNPNYVASPEFRLLKLSIEKDGYTQPIVVCKEDEKYSIIDGAHRYKIGTKYTSISKKHFSYLPVSIVDKNNYSKEEKICSTIRHNRARGKHVAISMSELVGFLTLQDWEDNQIKKNLGMDSDEVLRLKQQTGLKKIFKEIKFSEAWEIK